MITYCPKCGFRSDNGSIVCPKCGYKEKPLNLLRGIYEHKFIIALCILIYLVRSNVIPKNIFLILGCIALMYLALLELIQSRIKLLATLGMIIFIILAIIEFFKPSYLPY